MLKAASLSIFSVYIFNNNSLFYLKTVIIKPLVQNHPLLYILGYKFKKYSLCLTYFVLLTVKFEMSYPDPPPPHNQFPPHPSPGGFWPPLYMENEQPDLAEQFNHPQYKRPRNFENAPNFSPNLRVNQPPAPGSKGAGNIFYKTRICAKFTQGLCRNGETCSFAHGAEDKREPPPNWQDYVQEKDRSGGSNVPEDQRMNRRTKVCKYSSKEECPYGEKCNFVHERPFPPNSGDDTHFKRESSFISIEPGNFEREMPEQRESTVISIGTTNSTGDVFWKTKLCSKWEIGQCPYGDRCHYAHGVSDLKVADARVEAEPVLNAAPVPVNPLPSSVSVMAPPRPATAVRNGEDKNKLKWKVGKKINRIYGDWLDEGSPPRYLPNEED